MSKQLTLVLVAVAALLALPLIPRLLAARSTAEAVPPAKHDVSTLPATTPAANAATMAKAQFEQIQTGMSYAQCVQLAGGEGERSGPANAAGEEKYTWVLIDNTYGPGRTNIATLRFRNGVLYGKGISSKQNNRTTPFTSVRSGGM